MKEGGVKELHIVYEMHKPTAILILWSAGI